MKKNIISVCEVPELTIGIDLSDRTFRYCALNAEGKIVDEGERKLDPDSLRKFLAAQPAARVALEPGRIRLGSKPWPRDWDTKPLWPTREHSGR
jgi:hypothetical protein